MLFEGALPHILPRHLQWTSSQDWNWTSLGPFLPLPYSIWLWEQAFWGKKVQELQRRLLGWVLAAQPITRTGVWIPALITNSASTNASNYSPVGFDTLFWPPCMHRRATPTYACMYTQTHTHNKNKTILKSQRGIIGDFCSCKRNLVYHSGLM